MCLDTMLALVDISFSLRFVCWYIFQFSILTMFIRMTSIPVKNVGGRNGIVLFFYYSLHVNENYGILKKKKQIIVQILIEIGTLRIQYYKQTDENENEIENLLICWYFKICNSIFVTERIISWLFIESNVQNLSIFKWNSVFNWAINLLKLISCIDMNENRMIEWTSVSICDKCERKWNQSDLEYLYNWNVRNSYYLFTLLLRNSKSFDGLWMMHLLSLAPFFIQSYTLLLSFLLSSHSHKPIESLL